MRHSRLPHLNSRPAGAPAAFHRCLVEGPRLEEGPFWLDAAGLKMGQGRGAVSDGSVSPHGHLIHRPRRQVGGCKRRCVRFSPKLGGWGGLTRTVPLRNFSTTVKFLLSLT